MEVFLSVQVFWLIFGLEGQHICSLILPPCVMESLSMTDHYDVTLLHQISFLRSGNFVFVTHLHSVYRKNAQYVRDHDLVCIYAYHPQVHDYAS